MRILFILHETSIYNGSWKSVYNLISGLSEKNIDLLIICPDKHGAYEYLKDRGFNVYSIRFDLNLDKINSSLIRRLKFIPRYLRQKYYDYLWLRKVSQLCAEFKPDIIHSNSSVITIGYKLAKKLNISHVWHIREYGELDFSIRMNHTNKLLENNDFSISVTHDVQKFHGILPSRNNIVIYDGVLQQNRILLNIEDKQKYFLYAGSLVKGKGLVDLLKAWKIAKTQPRLANYKLMICGGSSTEITRYKVYCNKENIKDIEWLGKRDDAQILMRNASGVIIPSFNEAFGRVMPEAIANGALVIGRNTGGTKEQFENGLKILGKEIGIRFNNIDDLARIIIEVVSKPAKFYFPIIKGGQHVFEQLYTNEINVRNTLDFYFFIYSQKK